MVRKLGKTILRWCLKWKHRSTLTLGDGALIGRSSIFEGMNFIDKRSVFVGEMGYGSYIAQDSHLEGKIGRYSSIGSFVRCNPGTHPSDFFTSTSPVFYSVCKKQMGGSLVDQSWFEEIKYADDDHRFPIIIGNDCWIGDGVFFTGGITIGDGSIVLAHAVVTKNVPPYAIVGGVPAKVIKYRFEEDTIRLLHQVQWWNQSPTWLKEHAALMRDVNAFAQFFSKSK
jgi:acetyltransferase-like isoleucine patch superfamily enzyme